jgi:hypothetical protein
MGPSGGKHFVGPTLVDVLNEQMSLVGSVIPACIRQALFKRLKLLQAMGPLCLTLMGHGTLSM